MRTYLLKRLLLMVPTLLGVATIVFLLLRVLPGDVVLLRLAGEGGRVADEVLRAERARLGLDHALWRQYLDWIVGLGRGDLGLSMWTGRPVVTEIRIRLNLSLELTLLATLLAVAVAIPLGTLAALRRSTWLDYLLRVFTLSGLSLPSFWLGVLIILLLLRLFRWSPPLMFTSFWQDPVANLSQLVWPALVVGFRSAALSARMMRSALLDVLGDDYIRTARAKGLSERAVVRRHAVRNALLPVITVVGLESAVILGGLVVTEQVFNLNGLGKLLLEAVTRRDYTLTQALVMLSASAFVVMNLLVDLCYAWLDPRIRYR
ncbi:MAG TPA: ABC transporter permease [Methylomirabilota bacterium]|jgi:peptide/nickel transport system permease protein|nr:ABC transporter permease [Methylomirabilota bacterium]